MIYRGIVSQSAPYTSKKGNHLQRLVVELDSGLRVMAFKSPDVAVSFPVGSVCYVELERFPLATDLIPAMEGGD